MLWHSNCNFTKRAEWPPCTCPLKEINKNGTKIALLYEYLMSILTLRWLQEGRLEETEANKNSVFLLGRRQWPKSSGQLDI